MGSKDDLFDTDGRTVLTPRVADQSRGRPLSTHAAKPAPRREETVFDPGGPAPGGWSGARDVAEADAPPPDYARGKQIADDALFNAFAGLSYRTPNPMLGATGPLLMLLSDIRTVAVEQNLESLARHLAGAMREVDRKLAEGGVGGEDARIAKYVLCETADDIVGHLPGVDAKGWLSDGMLSRFFGSAAAGTGFFEALNKALADPEKHLDLLELMHACLALGFEGQYRHRAGGREAVRRIRRDVYETLRYFRERPGDEISPSWQGLSATATPARRRVPAWAIAAAMPAVVAAAFFALRMLATDRAELVAAELLALTPAEPAVIQHAQFAPVVEAKPAPPPPPVVEVEQVAQITRIRQALADGITAGNLSVASKGDFIVVSLNNMVLFDSGKAEVKQGFRELAEEVAAALSPEPGPIRIVGHTDNIRPGRTSVFKSNHDLSVARAEAVEEVLKPMVAEPSRLVVDGRGDEEPVADNSTPEGRAENRRVEIMIRKEETL